MTAVEVCTTVVADLVLAAVCVACGYWLGRDTERARSGRARDAEWDRAHEVTTTARKDAS